MRSLLLALLLASCPAFGWGYDANTVAYFDFNDANSVPGVVTDRTGNGNHLYWVGTPTYSSGTACALGAWAGGAYTDANYLTASAGLKTALSSLTTYTIEFYQYQYGGTYNTGGGGAIFWQGTNMGITQWLANSVPVGYAKPYWGAAVGPGFDQAPGVCYYVAFVQDGTARKLYVSPAASISQTPYATAADGANTGTVTLLYFGRYYTAGNFPTNGSFDNLRISNIARTSFPTTDEPTVAPSLMSPYLRNIFSPRLQPWVPR